MSGKKSDTPRVKDLRAPISLDSRESVKCLSRALAFLATSTSRYTSTNDTRTRNGIDVRELSRLANNQLGNLIK